MDLTSEQILIYAQGLGAGLVFGGIVGFLKYLFLWRNFFVKEYVKSDANAIFKRMIISYIVNAVALVAVLLARNDIPFEFASTAIGTAMALSISGRFFPMQKILEAEKTKNIDHK